jgi:hypothetical protein
MQLQMWVQPVHVSMTGGGARHILLIELTHAHTNKPLNALNVDGYIIHWYSGLKVKKWGKPHCQHLTRILESKTHLFFVWDATFERFYSWLHGKPVSSLQTNKRFVSMLFTIRKKGICNILCTNDKNIASLSYYIKVFSLINKYNSITITTRSLSSTLNYHIQTTTVIFTVATRI